MANKLAGQRAKFSRARAIFYTSGDDGQCKRASELMAEVLSQAPVNGFTEDEVTQSEDVPDLVRDLLRLTGTQLQGKEEDPDELIAELQTTLETVGAHHIGDGSESVYAYGYKCAPDRLKIGSCSGDAVARIAAQIGTSTPDKPVLTLLIRTHDCRALERALHNIFRLKGRKVVGAGAEWFLVTKDEIVATYEKILG